MDLLRDGEVVDRRTTASLENVCCNTSGGDSEIVACSRRDLAPLPREGQPCRSG